MEKLLSVIVPVYNAEKWLNRCIDSILKQGYKNFELILINDGSKDSSGAICDKYAECDERIAVIHKANEGVSMARNTGIDASHGKYIIFIDSDDSICDGFFESAVSGMQNVDWYICGAKELQFSNNEIINETEINVSSSKNISVAELYAEVGKSIPHSFVNTPWCKAYKSSIIRDNNLRFDKNFNLGEDILFNLSYCQHVKNVFLDEKIFYLYYRENENSLTATYSKTKYEDSLKIFDEWRKVIVKIGVDEEGLRSFENLYYMAMLNNIIYVYTVNKDPKERKKMIKKVVNNEWIRKNRSYKVETFKEKLLAFFITRKMPFMVKLLMDLRYGN